MIDAALMIPVAVFVGVVVFILGIYSYVSYRREHRRFMGRVEEAAEESTSEGRTDTAPLNVIRGPLLKVVTFLGKLVRPKNEGDISHIRKTFLKAGWRGENAPLVFFGVKTFLAILLPAMFLLLKLLVFRAMNPVHFMFVSMLLALIGFYLPSIWLKIRISRRKEKILEGLSDALDLMIVCVEAGVGLDAAMNRVAEEMRLNNKVLSEEFKLLGLELKAGKPRRDALRDLALRTDLEEVSSLATLLIQTDRFGSSVSQALRVHSDSVRTKRYQEAEEMAAKLAVKLVFPLILFIFPALLITILGPAVIRILRILFPPLTG